MDGIYLPLQLTDWLFDEVAQLIIGLTQISFVKKNYRGIIPNIFLLTSTSGGKLGVLPPPVGGAATSTTADALATLALGCISQPTVLSTITKPNFFLK